VENLNIHLENLRKKIETAQERNKQLAATEQKLNNEIDDLQGRKQELTKEKNRIEHSKNNLKEENDKLLTENRILIKHLKDTKKDFEETKLQLGAEKKKLSIARRSIKSYETQIAANNEKLKRSSTEVGKLENYKKQLEDEAIKLKASTIKFARTKEQLRQNIIDFQKNIKNFENWQVFDKQDKEKIKIALPEPKPAPKPKPVVQKPKPKPKPVKMVPVKKITCPIIEDTFLVEAREEEKKGKAQGLVVGYSKDHKNLRTVLKFDLSGLPVNAQIQKATLDCFCYTHHGSKEPINICTYLINSPWREHGANWKNIKYNPAPLSSTSVEKVNQWYAWNITNLAKLWHMNNLANFGVLLKADPEGGSTSNYLSFQSKENKSAPVLKIEYY